MTTSCLDSLDGLTNASSFTHEFRIVRPDGSVRWVETRGKTLFDASGEPERVLGICNDILGIIAAKDVTVADNAINTPQNITSSSLRQFDDTKDFYLHSVMMALDASFGVENYDSGPTNYSDCEGTNNGRGCLYLSGGVIQVERGAVGTSGGTGYTKRYSYDRCAIMTPPPYFPTTGRFNDSRYYELDPVGFNVKELFKAITPDK